MINPTNRPSRIRFSVASLLTVTTAVGIWIGWSLLLQKAGFQLRDSSFLQFGVPVLLLLSIVIYRRLSRR